MTKRQARTIMALCVAIILTQILCTAIVIRNQRRNRQEADAAQVHAVDTLEMQKQSAAWRLNVQARSLITTDARTAHARTPRSESRSFQALCQAYEETGRAYEQKKAELESLQLLEHRLEQQLEKEQQCVLHDPVFDRGPIGVRVEYGRP